MVGKKKIHLRDNGLNACGRGDNIFGILTSNTKQVTCENCKCSVVWRWGTVRFYGKCPI